ncbi:MAG: RagB/SusD family nutrient uptake outer membrane protein [Draconibacterium sp.]
MKRTYKIKQITALLFILMLGACDLEENLYSNLSPDNYFADAKSVETGVIAIYKKQNVIYGGTDFGMPRFTFLSAPHATSRNAGFRIYSDYTFSPADIHLFRLWSNSYSAINQANMIISKIPDVSMSEGVKAALMAEARFLRAYNYFNVVRLWGEVPFSLKETKTEADAYAPFTPAATIYESLLADLADDIINALPVTRIAGEKGRVTKTAALTLKAKIMLTMAGKPLEDNSHLSEAAAILNDLSINRAEYDIDLLTDYASIFDVNNKLNKEVIFAIQNDASVEGGGKSITFTSSPIQALTSKNGQALYAVDPDWYYDSFIDGDRRKDVVVESYFNYLQGKEISFGQNPYRLEVTRGLIPWKYKDPNCVTSNDGSADFIILRFADVLLMLGEVENELNGPSNKAINAINEVLERANANTLDYNNDPDGVAWTKESLREFIFQQRMVELCFEFHEIFDIRRFGKVQWSIENSIDCIAKGITYDLSMELYPIPTNELNARD